MRKYIYTLFLALTFFCSYAQPYGNEWINYNQPYFRIFIVNNGVYRIDSATLAKAGIEMTTLNPKNIQLFGRGEPQFIYVKGESDGKFNTTDFIEFYGMKNDGWYDSYLYDTPSDHPNPNYSMFNDTAIYYLTINPNALSTYRMLPENDTTYSSYTVAPFFYRNSRVDYTNQYFFGATDSYDITDPEYVKSEGWFDNGFSITGTPSITKNIPTQNAYLPGNASVEFKLIGASDYLNLKRDHHVNITFAGITYNDTLEAYYSKKYSKIVPASSLGSNTTSFVFSAINDLGCAADYNTLPYINIKYPHTLTLENDSNYTLYVPDAQGQTKSYLRITNFGAKASDTVRFYDLTNHKRIKVSRNNNIFKVLVPNSASEKNCFLTSDGQIKNISRIVPVSYDASNYAKFKDYTDASILQSDYLIVTHVNLLSEANAYKTYRETPNGGSYKPLVVDINELYDQFCYGIRKNPLAIKNFVHFAYDFFASPPKNLFLIGKGYRAAESNASKCYRKNASIYQNTLIPGFGLPPSDVLFTKLDTTNKQWVPTGRLAARNKLDVEIYRNKVIEYEYAQSLAQSGTSQEWMKNVLHFGGGSDIYQQNVLASYLNGYKNTIEGPYFGGYVRTFLKSSTDPMEFNLSDSLKYIINNGVSLMTFFGHGAGIGFDMSTDYPSAYNNKGKYPLILANSCLAGDLYNDLKSSSEEFVLIKEKGSIGYIAAIAKGLTSYLDYYSRNLYKNMGVYEYGGTIGKCIQLTIDTIAGKPNSSFYAKSTAYEMTLHGDPAIKLNYFLKPDYTITQPDIYFSPKNITSNDSIFNIHIISKNIGKAIIDSFVVSVKRVFPDGTSIDSVLIVPATIYKDTIHVKFPVDLAKGIGLNTFTIHLDYFNKINEIFETNNSTTATLFITSNDISPIYPYQYAIVPSLNLTLKASTGNPFATSKNYIFEIDTCDSFNSPIKISHLVNHLGGVVTYKPSFPITQDSIVYFWRVASSDTVLGGYKWEESSFQYINGKRGWGQSHFDQFKNNKYQYVYYNKPARKFEFVNDMKSILAQTGYFINDSYYKWTEEFYKVNGSLMSYWFCPGWYSNAGAIKIAVFDSVSGNPWISKYNGTMGIYPSGEYHCQNFDVPAFDFYFSTQAHRETVRKFLDSIPPQNYVLVMTHQANNCSQWDSSFIASMRSIGSDISVTNRINDFSPYILFGYKGAVPGSVNYKVGTPYGNLIQLTDTIRTKWDEGYIQSVTIGPAKTWDSLHWRVKSVDKSIADEVKINVVGIKADGTETILIKNLKEFTDIEISSVANSSIYPYLRLEAMMKDITYNTSPQMVRWQVTYDEMPETALDPSIHYSFYNDTIAEGDHIAFSTAIHNISEYNMDSLLVHYWIMDANRKIHPVYLHRYRPHPSNDVLIDTVTFSTLGLPGWNSIWIEANPNNDQPEQVHFNNIGQVHFYVKSDKINPLLDVTFDGIHILNGDIVSANPQIDIWLKDENKFLLLNENSDTSLFKIFIQQPNSSTVTRLYFKQQEIGEMIYFPSATSSDNKCHINFNANFTEDGTYKLIVQASDKSKNESGDMDYEINFEVINLSTITEVMNWPNPFSTSTRFVFTLTGSEIPTYFKIQVMTVTGKIVREIEMDELGPIHIGRNITQYAWDGKDDFGDQLANGVYLYRVITNINGKTIEKKNTSADKYFKQNFGKMFLMK